jgi:hypothetical protein
MSEYEISKCHEVQGALNFLKPNSNHNPGVLKNYISEIICIGLRVVSKFDNLYCVCHFYPD